MRLPPVILELSAQAADRDVDRAVERASLAPAQQVQQHVAGQHPVRPVQHRHQQVILAAGQHHLHPVRVEQAAPRRLQQPAAEAQAARRRLHPPLRPLGTAPQHRPDARQQLARVERLGQVVVGAELEPDDPVRLLDPRGQQDDRHVGLGAQPAREVEATLAGEHQVEHDELVVSVRPVAPGLPRIPRRGDAKPAALQEARQQLAYLAVVIDHQDVRHRLHQPHLARDL